MRYAARVSYAGTAYSGWQRQLCGTGVQEKIEAALRKISGDHVPVTAAGRTDAGVHALGQVISFDLQRDWRPDKLLLAINFHLPPDVSVMRAWRAPAGFDARRHALWREYRYFTWQGNAVYPALRSSVWWNRHHWDFQAMKEACRLYEGTHDFRAFCRTDECPERPIRTIIRASLARRGNLFVFTVRGNAFLTNMVRIMMGNLDAVGRGKKTFPWLEDMLRGRQRACSAMTATPEGLYLWKVGYGEGTPFDAYGVE